MSNPDFLSMNGNFGMLCMKGSRDLDWPHLMKNSFILQRIITYTV